MAAAGNNFYLLYRAAGPLLSIFKFNQSIKQKQRRSEIRSKVAKMDIQDAEFEAASK